VHEFRLHCVNPPTKLVHSIHFEDYDGKQFERLVFAYHLRTDQWRSLEWYGQVGGDLGRDIWGVRQDSSTICIQCANRRRVTYSKAIQAIDKVVTSRNGRPDIFKFVCACNVSAESRDKIKEYARTKGVSNCDIWSGPEFDEYLRARCETLIQRFVLGEISPDSAEELRRFVELPGGRVAMKKRLELHQELYTLWREFKNGLWFDGMRNKAEAGLREWFDRNCLYLDAKIREEIRSCLNEVGCFPGWRDRNETDTAKYQERVIGTSRSIEKAADLLETGKLKDEENARNP